MADPAQDTGSQPEPEGQGGTQDTQTTTQQTTGTALGSGDTGQQQTTAANQPTLPEDIADDPALKPHLGEDGTVDWQGVAKSFVHAQRMIGKDKVVVPGENAPKEEWDQFFAKLGRPNDPSSYQLEAPEGTEAIDEQLTEGFKKAAHEAGLSKTQARHIYEFLNNYGNELSESVEQNLQQQREEAEKTLKKEYGAATDKIVQGAREAMQHFAGDDADKVAQIMDDTGLGNDPTLIKVFANIRKAMSEDSLGPAIAPGRFGVTPEAARREINDLRTDPAYMNPMDPRHKDIMARIEELVPQTEGGE